MDGPSLDTANAAPARTAANQAAWLLAATGALTLANNYLPGHEHLNIPALTAVAIVALALSLTTRLTPWERLPARATLALPLIAFTLITVANYLGGVSAYSYGVYFIVVFAWVGLNHTPGTSSALAPLAVIAYVLPILLAPGHSMVAVWSVTVPIPVGVFLGETIARVMKQLAEVRDRLQEASLVDELTGLHNRRGFMSLAEHRVAVAARARESVCLLFIDIDNFKYINDSFGHSKGDEALQSVAQMLRSTFRESDLIGRLGGDEFCVLTSESDYGATTRIRERVHAATRARNAMRGEANLSMSFGVKIFEAEAKLSLEQMIHAADAEMYEQKFNSQRFAIDDSGTSGVIAEDASLKTA